MSDLRAPKRVVGAISGAAHTRPAARGRALDERALVGGLIAFMLLVATIPTLVAYLGCPPERRFQGIVYGVADTAQYFSWLRDHRTAWLVPNRMTSEPNAPALFNLLWLVVARMQVATGLPTAALFHTVRVMAGAALLAALYATCARFTRGRAERLTAFLVLAFGSGLGWVWVAAKHLQGLADVPHPFDIYVAEPNTLLILMAFPHFAIATTLILAIFLCFLAALRRRNLWLVAGAALLALALTLQHAYDLLIITLVPGGALALMLLRDRRVPWFAGLSALAIGLVALPPPLYFTWLTSRDPLWREVLDQFSNAGVFTPPPHHLLILMGVPLLLVVIVMADVMARPRRAERLRLALAAASDEDLLLYSWLIMGFGLLYIPADFQIHMLTAWQVPVGLLAARWLHRRAMPAIARARPRLAWAMPVALLAAVLPTSVYLVSWRTLDLSRYQAPYSIRHDQEAALRWLGGVAAADDVVLSSLTLGQYVPVYCDAHTVLGHWAQTAHYYEKESAIASFFDPAVPDSARQHIIAKYGVTYVIHSAEEQLIGAYDLSRSTLFVEVFREGDSVVYRVRGG